MEKLELVFTTAGKGTVSFSVDNPKEGLTLAEVQEKAPTLAKILVTRSGVAAGELKSAKRIKTTSEDLV